MPKVEVNYEVEEGVPIPVQRSEAIPISSLEVGQSILFSSKRRVAMQSYASRLKKSTGKVFTLKKVDDENHRIWRTK